MNIHPFYWSNNRLYILDQRCLPHKIKYLICRTFRDVVKAIREMAVRGAPAIGCCAAYGMVLAVKNERDAQINAAARRLKRARPTAVNLAWAVDRMMARWATLKKSRHPAPALLREAHRITRDDIRNNRTLARIGASLFKRRASILTHCNAGALATAGIGTSLGVIREVFRRGKLKKVWVDETRPFLQGARLTAWELDQERIPHELITDSMAGHFMQAGDVDAVIVGCDRVAANGDVANKIGTYGLAVLAHHHRIPFYVAMPGSTFDRTTPTGNQIQIEERSSEEVVAMGGRRMAPRRTRARHPAFDVTPARFITAIISERGLFRPPFRKSLRRLRDAN